MSLEWEQTVVEANDPASLGRWWSAALGWIVVNDDPEEFEIRPAPDRLPGLLFVRTEERKQTKNRLHFDFRPIDQASEVDRLLDLGASRVDIGQGRPTWVVLADPEGKRVLHPELPPAVAAVGHGNTTTACRRQESLDPIEGRVSTR